MSISGKKTAFALSFTAIILMMSLPVHATLIDILVEGTWQNVNNPVINPLGLSIGDKFFIESTYDDATFFNGSEGVTADVTPGINPGTSLRLIIPNPGTSPNPIEFDHNDFIDIGFAPNTQIEFDGPNAGNPGSFRNFEFHFEGNFLGDNFEFDQFMRPFQPETDIFNISQGANLAAGSVGIPGGTPDSNGNVHLNVICQESAGGDCNLDDFLNNQPPPDTGGAPIPEPSTMLLLGSGLAGLAFFRMRRKDRQNPNAS